MGNKGTRYSDEFKCEAVNLVKQEGYTQQKAAERLGIHPVTLAKWIKTYESAGSGDFEGNPFEMQREIKRLREENRQLKMEKEILKKASAFFAKEMK